MHNTMMEESRRQEQRKLYLVGINVSHSVGAPMHNAVISSLFPSSSSSSSSHHHQNQNQNQQEEEVEQPNYIFQNTECPSISSVMELFNRSDFAGGVVTMPYKKTIMPFLANQKGNQEEEGEEEEKRKGGLDDLALRLGAVNNVYIDRQTGKLRGTNTDWRGVLGCLTSGVVDGRGVGGEKGRPGLVVGAGGAARAAVYALAVHLGCRVVYVINRHVEEVEELVRDTKGFFEMNDSNDNKKKKKKEEEGEKEKKVVGIVHITDPEQVKGLEMPYYAVGTVPDFEPTTTDELTSRASLLAFLQKPTETKRRISDNSEEEPKGIFLDMCYKPRWTRHRKLASEHGWVTVDGVEVIGYQAEEQWRLWTGAGEKGSLVGKVPVEEAKRVLREAADKSHVLN